MSTDTMKVTNKLDIPASMYSKLGKLIKEGNLIRIEEYMETQINLAYDLGVEQGLLEALTKLRQELGE